MAGARILQFRSFFISSMYPLRYRHNGTRVDFVPYFASNIIERARELGEGGGWIVGVAARALGVEGGALVPGQRNAIFDA